MKYGIREICDVVFKAKGVCKVGNRIFYKDEPIMYFDTLKTSSLEAASSSVYAQGGRGNPRLIAWDGDRTLTFNMEDALISSEGLQILSGAGLMEASVKNSIKVHSTSQLAGSDVVVVNSYALTSDTAIVAGRTYYTRTGTDPNYTYTVVASPVASALATYYVKSITSAKIYVPKQPYWPQDSDSHCTSVANYVYVFPLDEYGEVFTEPFIPDVAGKSLNAAFPAMKFDDQTKTWSAATGSDKVDGYEITLKATDDLAQTAYNLSADPARGPVFGDNIFKIFGDNGTNAVLVDYYVEKTSGAQQIEITADKFGGTYYIEGDTLFRTQQGLDMPAEFIIPNGKIQSNFTFSMAATGDPSTFTFTVDAMPDYTRFDKTKKVLAAIQIIQDGAVSDASRERTYTAAPDVDESIL